MSNLQTAPSGTDYPGKTLGIVGLVLVFFTIVIGLVLSAVALSQSKNAGYTNTPAKIGVILGSIFLAILVLWVVIVFVVAGLAVSSGQLG
ncbi:hypothetical protein D7I47_05565 [Protaetiibacter intestinalis]|uniref:DUF4190 domain-containing protein n=2 Tax=Protaetiibacter intestinalis TaxID=2419774 RepID=A0A387B5U0_9MICO|nr:hypothetical protein D7I47_05565 [Protaetiibacter intestinalis]